MGGDSTQRRRDAKSFGLRSDLLIGFHQPTAYVPDSRESPDAGTAFDIPVLSALCVPCASALKFFCQFLGR